LSVFRPGYNQFKYELNIKYEHGKDNENKIQFVNMNTTQVLDQSKSYKKFSKSLWWLLVSEHSM